MRCPTCRCQLPPYDDDVYLPFCQQESHWADPTHVIVTDGSDEAERDVYLSRIKAQGRME
jgi:endogenous inhibitor of DNA gyrase (YacG/DUF329 family)